MFINCMDSRDAFEWFDSIGLDADDAVAMAKLVFDFDEYENQYRDLKKDRDYYERVASECAYGLNEILLVIDDYERPCKGMVNRIKDIINEYI